VDAEEGIKETLKRDESEEEGNSDGEYFGSGDFGRGEHTDSSEQKRLRAKMTPAEIYRV